MRTRLSLVASVVVGGVLLCLAMVSWSALASIRDAQQLTLRTRDSAFAYGNLRGAIAGEAAAEAGYRRAPSAAARVRLERSIAAVDDALVAARTATDLREGPTLSSLSLLNQRYVDQVRATLDAPVTGADDRVAGPALDSIQRLLDAAIDTHIADLGRASRTEINLASRLRWILPASFGLALAILGGTLRKLLREHRRVGLDAAEAKELAQTRARLLVEEQRQVILLRDIERSRADFLAMVAHDLGNPITVIAGYAELLAEGQTPHVDVVRLAQVICDRSHQIRRLVSDLGNGASPSTIDETLPIDLAVVVKEAVESSAADVAHAGIILDSRFTTAPIDGDADRIRQVVDNLLGNAIKYTPRGGRVWVDVGSSAADAVLTIRDTGIGIPEAQLPNVFERFFRASTAAAAGLPGTGLGLTITKAIVEGHHGTITATSIEPQGTAFEVRIPLAAHTVTDQPQVSATRCAAR